MQILMDLIIQKLILALNDRPEIDRWVLSKLNSLVKNVDEAYASFEPTRAGRLIQEFVGDQLSNWYVRLCRRRYWKQSSDEAGANDKISAYQTLYTCLETVAVLACADCTILYGSVVPRFEFSNW